MIIFLQGKWILLSTIFLSPVIVEKRKRFKLFMDYHYVEILGQKGNETGYKIAYFAKPIAASTETDNAAIMQLHNLLAASHKPRRF